MQTIRYEAPRRATTDRRSFVTGAAASAAALTAISLSGTLASPAHAADAGAGGAGAHGDTGEAPETVYYDGSAAGRRGRIYVKVGLAGTRIVSVDVVKQRETPLIAATALSRIPQLIVRNQSLDVDSVTGATMTSAGIRLAVADALDKAGLSDDDLANSGRETGVMAQVPPAADIAVVGAGLTGLVATVRALQLGKTVALIEESGHVGGSSCVSDGWITGADTIMERTEGTQDSADQFYAFLSQGSDDPSVVPYPEVVRRFAETAGPVLDWLDSYVNVDFGDRKGGYGLYVAPDQPRIYGVNNGGGAMDDALMELVQDAVAEGRCSVTLECRATKIDRDETGCVSGLELTFADGTAAAYPCRAVIAATGGYTHNQDMMPYENCGSCSPSTASGHGWKLLENAGALMDPRAKFAPYAGGIPVSGFEMRYQANLKMPGIVWIAPEGTRMGNEDVPLMAKKLWGTATGNVGYILFSEAQRSDAVRPIVLTSYLEGELTPWESWNLLDNLVAWDEVAWKAETAEELGEKAGIDPGALAATVETYNGYCATGSDPEFGRTNLQELVGTLYLVKTVPYQLQGTGGARVTPEAEVLDADEAVIAGLFAGGEAIGMRQACGGSQGGCGLGHAATFGYIAAESACAYLG